MSGKINCKFAADKLALSAKQENVNDKNVRFDLNCKIDDKEFVKFLKSVYAKKAIADMIVCAPAGYADIASTFGIVVVDVGNDTR